MLKEKEKKEQGIRVVEITQIIPDQKFQPRVKIDKEAVDEYKEAILRGEDFKPIVVIENQNDTFSIVSGFHRFEAYKLAEKEELSVEVKNLSELDALVESIESNTTHGVRYTNKDKRNCIKKLLENSDALNWSDNRIAKTCKVSNHLVKDVREEFKLFPDGGEVEYVRNGKTHTTEFKPNIPQEPLSEKFLIKSVYKLLNKKTVEIRTVLEAIKNSMQSESLEVPSEVSREVEEFVQWYLKNKEVA